MPELGARTHLLLRSLSWVAASSVLSLAASSAVALVLPKVLGVEEYGYFQFFLFWTTFAGVLTFGVLDGLHLRYAGLEYARLEGELMASQLRLVAVTQMVLAGVLVAVSATVVGSTDRAFVIGSAAVAALLLNVRGVPVVLLQATYRARAFSRLVVLERLTYLALLVAVLSLGSRDYRAMVACALIAFFLTMASGLWSIRDVALRRPVRWATAWREAAENAAAGLPLLISNVAALLVIGIMRLAIERHWGIAAFGGVSLLLSLAGLAVAVMNVVGLLIFPLFRRASAQELRESYATLSTVLSATLLGLLLVYYPLRLALELWLPAYAATWTYLILVLPLAVYESRQVLLLSTVLKVIRRERLLLAINLAMLAMAAVLAVLTTSVLSRFDFAIGSITALVLLRAAVTEITVGRLIGLRLGRSVFTETTVVLAFVVVGSTIDSWLAVPVHLGVYLSYLYISRRALRSSSRHLASLLTR